MLGAWSETWWSGCSPRSFGPLSQPCFHFLSFLQRWGHSIPILFLKARLREKGLLVQFPSLSGVTALRKA